VPQAAFEGFQAAISANRSEFYRAVPTGPFYNFDQPGVEPSEAIIANWWRQGMTGGAKGQYDCVSAFISQDYSEDLKKISVPVLVMHSKADQIVPYATSGPRAAKLLANGTLKTYEGFPHGMPTTHADTINPDLLAFIQS
jgi:non-heme chloroperoxidase